MKKLRILLILCLTLAVTLPAASANSWNLNGQLLAMVEQTHDYDEYTGLVSDYNRKAATTHTILTSRYHNQLVAVDEVKDGWKDAIFSTTAVYQPSELDEAGYPKITQAAQRDSHRPHGTFLALRHLIDVFCYPLHLHIAHLRFHQRVKGSPLIVVLQLKIVPFVNIRVP